MDFRLQSTAAVNLEAIPGGKHRGPKFATGSGPLSRHFKQLHPAPCLLRLRHGVVHSRSAVRLSIHP